VGSIGTVLVAASNGKTVYQFANDVKDSGKSNCTGGCATTWPPLTVTAGATPSGGSGVPGTLGTITRADDGTLQVTYNGPELVGRQALTGACYPSAPLLLLGLDRPLSPAGGP
jgi:predicted lipoprotein with Yx(FWY)xxD motif